MNHLDIEFTDLVVKPSDNAKRWRELHAEAKAADEALESVRREAEAAQAGVELASNAYKAALKEKAAKAKVTKLETELASAKARAAEPWRERIEVAQTDFDDARNAAHRFAAENADELIAEDLVPLTLEAVDRRKLAAEALLDAIEFERQVERRMNAAIIHKPGVYPRDVMPSEPLDADVERALLKVVELPARLPRDTVAA